jgi:hypothetical protein
MQTRRSEYNEIMKNYSMPLALPESPAKAIPDLVTPLGTPQRPVLNLETELISSLQQYANELDMHIFSTPVRKADTSMASMDTFLVPSGLFLEGGYNAETPIRTPGDAKMVCQSMLGSIFGTPVRSIVATPVRTPIIQKAMSGIVTPPRLIRKKFIPIKDDDDDMTPFLTCSNIQTNTVLEIVSNRLDNLQKVDQVPKVLKRTRYADDDDTAEDVDEEFSKRHKESDSQCSTVSITTPERQVYRYILQAQSSLTPPAHDFQRLRLESTGSTETVIPMAPLTSPIADIESTTIPESTTTIPESTTTITSTTTIPESTTLTVIPEASVTTLSSEVTLVPELSVRKKRGL